MSFVSSSKGFVLGTSHCAKLPCTEVVTTSDGGKTWSKVAAPKDSFASAASRYSASVSQLVFANKNDGWAYGNAIWQTTNGASSWKQISLGGPVFSLASSATEAYAVVGSCSPGTKKCTAPTLKVERTAVGSNSWQKVPGVTGYGDLAMLAVSGQNAWVATPSKSGAADLLWTTKNAGATWHSLPDVCYKPSQAAFLSGLASPGGRTLFELCAGNPGAGQEGKSLMVSTNGGSTAHLVYKLPTGGIFQGIAATGGQKVFVSAASGASYIYYSSNSGKTWAGVVFGDGGAGVSDISFATPAFGTAIEGQPITGPTDKLLITHNGGANWSAIKI